MQTQRKNPRVNFSFAPLRVYPVCLLSWTLVAVVPLLLFSQKSCPILLLDLIFCLASLAAFSQYCQNLSIIQKPKNVPIFILALTIYWLCLCFAFDPFQQFIRALILLTLWKILTHSWRLDQLEAAGGFLRFPSFLNPQELLDLNAELQQAFASGFYPPNRPPLSFGSFDSIEWPVRDDYDVPSGNPHPMLPVFRRIYERMAALVPEQQFDIISAHKYVVNDYVNKHQDPSHQMGTIVLLVAGDFSGGVLQGDQGDLIDRPGDLIIMFSRASEYQGERPPHLVTPITRGVRYSLTLCTLVMPDFLKPRKTV